MSFKSFLCLCTRPEITTISKILRGNDKELNVYGTQHCKTTTISLTLNYDPNWLFDAILSLGDWKKLTQKSRIRKKIRVGFFLGSGVGSFPESRVGFFQGRGSTFSRVEGQGRGRLFKVCQLLLIFAIFFANFSEVS